MLSFKHVTLAILLALVFIICLKHSEGFTTENFIPLLTQNNDYSDESKNEYTSFSQEVEEDRKIMKSNDPSSSCIQTDPIHNEVLSDPCTPVATFKNELNAQGMNDITGFSFTDMTASPLA